MYETRAEAAIATASDESCFRRASQVVYAYRAAFVAGLATARGCGA